MSQIITLAVDVQADTARLFEILTTTEGQRAFWTADCDVAADRARFGFEASPVDLDVTVTTEPDKLVRMSVASGFPFWRDSNWSGDCPPRCAPRPDAETGTPQPFFPAPA